MLHQISKHGSGVLQPAPDAEAPTTEPTSSRDSHPTSSRDSHPTAEAKASAKLCVVVLLSVDVSWYGVGRCYPDRAAKCIHQWSGYTQRSWQNVGWVLVCAHIARRASSLQPGTLLGSGARSLAMVLPSCSSAQSCEVCPNSPQHHALRPKRDWQCSQWARDRPDPLQHEAHAELYGPGDASRAEITFRRSNSESHLQMRIVWRMHTC